MLLTIARVVFWMAIIATMAGAFAPPALAVQVMPWDKAGHFLVFYVVTMLAVVAFPNRRVVLIALALSAFGALIELVQSLSFVERDGDWRDWVADTAAIAAVVIPMALVRWRDDLRA